MGKARVTAFVAAVSIMAGSAWAQDVIAQRKQLMREQGAATAPVGRMLNGGEPFDMAKTQAALDAYLHTTREFRSLFPAGSDQGQTRAAPAIFQDREKFDAAVAKFEADTTAAKNAIKDEASFKAEMPKVLANCGTCHTAFRTSR
ncbi:MAG: cytochrome c [Rhizobiales bacterium]|nr:cytochrome c [Hyphomicrobiales bacterium]